VGGDVTHLAILPLCLLLSETSDFAVVAGEAHKVLRAAVMPLLALTDKADSSKIIFHPIYLFCFLAHTTGDP